MVASASFEHLEATSCQTEINSLTELEEKELDRLLNNDLEDDHLLLSSSCSSCEPDIEDGIVYEAPIADFYPMEPGVSLSFLRSIQYLDEIVFPI
ncbi:MAG: hypothetical protein VX642_04890 [Bdellovibrionota bacterium]|nr:hypothetical protein [Bdellovibrionota bacterium]